MSVCSIHIPSYTKPKITQNSNYYNIIKLCISMAGNLLILMCLYFSLDGLHSQQYTVNITYFKFATKQILLINFF